MRPQLPKTSMLIPYLERIDEARYYSNHGQLLLEFQQRLARHFEVDPSELEIVANGTVALSAALIAIGARPGSLCLLPSWTFVASAAAVWAANLRPHFVDIDPVTWMPDPQKLRSRPDLNQVGAIMIVSPFGSPVDTKVWDDFTSDTGIPVIIDCAAGFDTVATVEPARPGKSPIMISLHATKVFGIGEGGIVISRDREFIKTFTRVCNFGVLSTPEGQILGYNGKQSEYHAAVGLAMLDMWPERRAIVSGLTDKYKGLLSDVAGVSTVPGYGEGWVSCYCNVRLNRDSQPVIDLLAQRGIDTRRWWQFGVHPQHAYQAFSKDDLPNTETLGRQVFGLPFFHDITDEQLQYVVGALGEALTPAHSAK